MAPPSFSDLGKDAKDLLTKNYFFGVLNVKFGSSVGDHKLSSNFNQHFKAKKIASDIEGKISFPSYGATYCEKWTSEDVLKSELTIEDKLVKGMKQTFSYSRQVFDGLSSASITNGFKSDTVNANVDVFFKSAIPDITPSLVVSHLGYLAGVDFKLDSTNRQLQRANFAVGYQVPEFAFHGLISNWGKCFGASISQRITDRFELAGSVSWSRDTEQVAWSVGSKYVLDEQNGHFVKAKLDHLTRISLSLTTYLTKKFQFSLCGMFNGPEMPQLGLGFDLEY
ncbi:Voltage-dependent anion-selective channel protein 1 [Clonorchis sinensis]|uniref:Voltage-dependent anion-selective channel protein 1 n=1 Tax=Clonorchis sinensis TaxID=79923 RepID=A0A3R7F5X7_CLOSI|nr:Voltage-dependent anion-selective channel protein 1 [Clonorchis sinensis]